MTKRHLSSGTYTIGLIAAISVATAISGASCTPTPPTSTASSTGTASAGGTGGAGGGMTSTSSGMGGTGGNTGGFNDFPATPIYEEGLAADVGALFDAVEAMPGGPCISEPASDAMVPRNWTPIFLEWNAAPEMNVFEIKLEVDNQKNPFVAYTTKTSYSMPWAIWAGLSDHSAGRDVKMTIRGGRVENGAFTVAPLASETGVLHIAPVAAPGSVVYWAYEPISKATAFRGFTVGDTATKVVLTPATAGINAGGKQTGCISCHASSPDGKVMFYSSDDPPGYHRSIDARLVTGGKPGPDIISDAAFALLGRHRQLAPILSVTHYSPEDAVVLTVYRSNDMSLKFDLIWTDLHATDMNGWGVIARNGDPRNPTSVSWRHDGTEIAYVSSLGGIEGVIASSTPQDPVVDIYTVPYNNRLGGDAKPLPGASEPLMLEFYPVYSPEDTFIAFNRTDRVLTIQTSYDQTAAEIYLIESKGGVPVRLKANDPPVCTGLKSPGLTNSWTRWSPQATIAQDLKYYWLVYSSKRRVAAGLRPQLYVSAIVTKYVDGKEVLHAEYPGVYVASQDPAENNHTPQWDYFVVDDIPK